MKDIQAVMEDAERSFVGGDYPDIATTLRNIVATSAISHGVDVDRFNSMFFAGLPSDIAEYIQALEQAQDTAELPEASGDAIAKEFERYLRRRGEEPTP